MTPREDGTHTEIQMGAGLDEAIARSLAEEGVADLAAALEDFSPAVTPVREAPAPMPGSGAGAVEVTRWNVALTMSDRFAPVGDESVLAREYVLASMLAGWSRDVDTEREDTWLKKKALAEARLVKGLHKKQKPTLS